MATTKQVRAAKRNVKKARLSGRSRQPAGRAPGRAREDLTETRGSL